MAFFTCKQERDDYRDDFCRHCQHSGSCALWKLQLDWNDGQQRDPTKVEALDRFIPRMNGQSHHGIGNGPCSMFIESGEARRPSW